MPTPKPSASPKKSVAPEGLPEAEVDELLTALQNSHGLYYKMMNLEVWAIVETLDRIFPGSWGRFMANRKVAMKQFIQRQQAKGEPTAATDLGSLGTEEEAEEFQDFFRDGNPDRASDRGEANSSEPELDNFTASPSDPE